MAKREAAGDPALGAAHERGDLLLGELMAVIKLPHKGGLFDEVPLSAVTPGEDLPEGLFLGAVPDLGPHRVAPAVPYRLYPQIAVEEHEGVR